MQEVLCPLHALEPRTTGLKSHYSYLILSNGTDPGSRSELVTEVETAFLSPNAEAIAL